MSLGFPQHMGYWRNPTEGFLFYVYEDKTNERQFNVSLCLTPLPHIL